MKLSHALLLCAAASGLAPSRRPRQPRTRRPVLASPPEETQASAAPAFPPPGSAPERWVKSTKQLATVGPASSTAAMLEKLFAAGVDVFRLNFSHGAHEEKAELVRLIRALERKYDHPIGILADLQGPKLRVGVFGADAVMLVEGQRFRLDSDAEPGDAARVQLPHPEILATLGPGDLLLVDDGKLRLRVLERGEGFVETEVEVGGKMSDRKGVNTPSVVLPISPLTPKDRADLEFACAQPVDWVALSFVQRPSDVDELRRLCCAHGRADLRLMAKLEKPAAVAPGTLEAIVDKCDGIMVARGDLGVEMNPEDVPVVQKAIVQCCRARGTPVVVATQMLESMIESPTPTRAECSDVATALYDGADAVMLSAESAAGKFPEEAVAMQRRVISRVEGDPSYRAASDARVGFRYLPDLVTATDAITLAARQVSSAVGAKCQVVFTEQGSTVLKAARGRPPVPILALTPSRDTARALALVWGVYSRVLDAEQFEEQADFRDVLVSAVAVAGAYGLLRRQADLAVVTAGLPWGTPGASNVLRVVPATGPYAWPEELCSVEEENCA